MHSHFNSSLSHSFLSPWHSPPSLSFSLSFSLPFPPPPSPSPSPSLSLPLPPSPSPSPSFFFFSLCRAIFCLQLCRGRGSTSPQTSLISPPSVLWRTSSGRGCSTTMTSSCPTSLSRCAILSLSLSQCVCVCMLCAYTCTMVNGSG